MRRCITEYLVQEHQELAHLLNDLQEQLSVLHLARDVSETIERLKVVIRGITKTLHAHLEGEEQILYPALVGHVQGIAGTLERMRCQHDNGEAVEKAFLQCVERLAKNGRSRHEVMQSGRSYVQWLRSHLLEENGRLFPLVERGLDPQTQAEVRRAMEELRQETTARIAEVLPNQSPA
jgi:hemerythrin-like domain-containing protein